VGTYLVQFQSVSFDEYRGAASKPAAARDKLQAGKP
jgi:hypothetical protein